MKTLEPGDRFPTISAPAIDGSRFTLPADTEGLPVVLVFYRGHW